MTLALHVREVLKHSLFWYATLCVCCGNLLLNRSGLVDVFGEAVYRINVEDERLPYVLVMPVHVPRSCCV